MLDAHGYDFELTVEDSVRDEATDLAAELLESVTAIECDWADVCRAAEQLAWLGRWQRGRTGSQH